MAPQPTPRRNRRAEIASIREPTFSQQAFCFMKCSLAPGPIVEKRLLMYVTRYYMKNRCRLARLDLDRYHLVMDVIDRVPGLRSRAAHVRQAMVDRRAAHRAYIVEHGEDPPEIRDWKWPMMPDEAPHGRAHT